MKRVNLSFSAWEYQRIKTIASARGLKAGTFLRVIILREINKAIGRPQKSETIDMFETIKTKRGKK